MNDSDRLDYALDQFDRVLGFFSRVESKITAVFALNTGLLAVLCLNVRPADLGQWYITSPAVIALALLILSLFFVYQASFPSLKGGAGSLVYFREIAGRTENAYIQETLAAKEEEYLRDVLAQIWRNSEILTAKFAATKLAFSFTASALVPWAWFLVATSVTHSTIPIVS